MPSVCVPAAFLFSVPAFVNTGKKQQSIATGVAWLLAMSNTPLGWLTKLGVFELVVRAKSSRSSPPSVMVPALSQRRSSPMYRAPPLFVRLMLLLEPAGVSSVPAPRR